MKKIKKERRNSMWYEQWLVISEQLWNYTFLLWLAISAKSKFSPFARDPFQGRDGEKSDQSQSQEGWAAIGTVE